MGPNGERVIGRREVLRRAAGAALAASGAWPQAQADEPVGPTIVDAHTHFYDPRRPQGVPWPPKDNALLYHPVLPSDFLKVAAPFGVRKTIVVEASAWVEDNQWILDLAERETSIVGFVGHLTPGEPDFARHLTRFAKNRLYRGIRVDGPALAAGLEQSAYRDDLRRLADHDLELDVNGGPSLLPVVARLARELPGLRIVINHVANLPNKQGGEPNAAWREGMLAAGRFPQVFCKVSALVEGTGAQNGDAPTVLDFYRPVLDVVWQAFGEDRLIYGSNWPVSDRSAPYGVVFSLVRDYFTAKGPSVLAKFFAGNARAAYKWLDR